MGMLNNWIRWSRSLQNGECFSIEEVSTYLRDDLELGDDIVDLPFELRTGDDDLLVFALKSKSD